MRIVVLGSTGSVGRQTLEVLQSSNRFQILGLSAQTQGKLLAQQIRNLKVPFYFFPRDLKIPNTRRVESLGTLIKLQNCRAVVNAISGEAGLEPSLLSLQAKRKLYLANKESVVLAGPGLRNLAKRQHTEIIPLDSELNAVWQCLQGEDQRQVRRVYLTCSGGPFYGWPLQKIQKVTPAQTLRHPRWGRMGAKISVDSATLVNKALEIIETAYLFKLKPEQIQVLIHPESVVHALVEFRDGSSKALLYPPDMKSSISAALHYPKRQEVKALANNWLEQALHFTYADPAQFPVLALAYKALQRGPAAAALLCRENERLAKLFLEGKISLPQIVKTLSKLFS